MNSQIRNIFLLSIIGIFFCSACTTNGKISQAHLMHAEYAATEAHPFGQKNPAAPETISDYEFLVGNWDCETQIRNKNEWIDVKGSMRGEYYLNGFGILNHTYAPDNVASMTYEYDVKKKLWMIVNSGAPEAKHSVWTGQREGSERITRRTVTREDGSQQNLQIRFFDIASDSFSWALEAVTPNGLFVVRKKTCQRI